MILCHGLKPSAKCVVCYLKCTMRIRHQKVWPSTVMRHIRVKCPVNCNCLNVLLHSDFHVCVHIHLDFPDKPHAITNFICISTCKSCEFHQRIDTCAQQNLHKPPIEFLESPIDKKLIETRYTRVQLQLLG